METCRIGELNSVNGVMRCTTGVLTWCVQSISSLFTTNLSPLLLPAALGLVVLKLWRMYTNSKDPTNALPLPPGSMGWPIIGETLQLIMKGSDFFRERTASYGKIYKTHILGQKTIRVTGAHNVAKILQGEGTLVQSQWPPSTKLILGDGALAHSKGEKHRWRRELIMKAFSPQALKSYVPAVQSIVKEHVDKWCKAGSIHGYPEARSMTFTVASKLLLGFDVADKQKQKMLLLFEDMLATLFSMPIPIPGIGLYKGLKARNRVMKEIENCIKARQDSDDTDKPEDALALILEASEAGDRKLTMKEMQDSALEMLFAGHLPTSSAASSVLMMLGAYPKVYDKISVELFEAGLLDPQIAPELSYESLQDLHYIDAVVKEVLRVAPPVGAGYRKALQTFEVDGHQVPKGWTVVYSIRETQHTSSAFTNGTDFDPERWLARDERLAPVSADANNFDFVPFGWGERSCVAQKYVSIFLKTFIIELVRNASWKLTNGKPDMAYMPVPHPKDNLPLQMKAVSAEMRRRAFTLSW